MGIDLLVSDEVTMLRHPAVAGQFYEGTPDRLRSQVERCIIKNCPHESARVVVCPHAGLNYSGPVAGAVYSRVRIPERLILIGPNHTGLGSMVSVYGEGSWNMPNGPIPIDRDAARRLVGRCAVAEFDTEAHRFEHSLEVQLPFLQYFRSEFTILPVIMMTIELAVCREVGETLASIVEDAPGPVLVIASTDMSHYEPEAVAREKDRLAIDQVLSLDPVSLHRIVRERQISMCGFAPTVAALFAGLRLGAKNAKLVRYMTSGETSGDYGSVVGYAGIIID